MIAGRRAPLFLSVALVVCGLLYLAIAREGPGARDLLQWIGSWFGGEAPAPEVRFVLANIRLPRLLVAAFGGASLALAGVVMQATFRNPLASPTSSALPRVPRSAAHWRSCGT